MTKKCALIAGLLAALFLGVHPARAGGTEIAIAVSPKKENGEKKRSGEVTKQETNFQYTVTLTNGSFAAVGGLTAEYRIFIREDSGKGVPSQQKLERKEFSTPIPDMPNGGTYSFDTETVQLQKSTLEGGWIYTNGTRPQSADRIAGVWIRILQGEKVVGEYVNPSTIASRETF